jgi:predicted RNase H-like HicB family nuclease
VIDWDPEERVYVATVPALTVSTYGETHKEALRMAREAIDVTVEGLQSVGQPILSIRG